MVRSNTGQVRFEYGRGVCTIDAPCASGAAGFLKNRGVIETSGVRIDSQNEYASVLVVSLDGLALSRSRRVLVQVGTRARPTGWVEREATFKSDDGKQTFHGKQVVSTGAMPWAIEQTRIKLTIKNAGLRAAVTLDSNGNARETFKAAPRAAGFKSIYRMMPCTSCSRGTERETPSSTDIRGGER